MSMAIDSSQMVEAFARLKNIPVFKVLRNAARDFAKAAIKATPTAKISKSSWYRARKNGKTWYIPESRMAGRKIRNAKDGDLQIRKVRVRKGWSKATWLGIMQELGLVVGAPVKRLQHARDKATLTNVASGANPSVTISDQLRIDNFGRASTRPRHEAIAKAGFDAAAKNITREFERLTKEAWAK